jgi:energy-coupling factor transport system ATP-binding protein
MIRGRGISFSYPVAGRAGASQRRPALRNIDIDLPACGRVALLGTSGSGKSTLALCLAGLLHPGSGEVTIDGIPTRGDRRQLAWRIGCLFQQPAAQLLTRHVADEIALPLEQLGWARPDIWRRVAEVLAGLGLERLATRDPQTLSGGEMQRVALAAAIAPMPRYVFLDEPLAYLDDTAAEQVEDWLGRAGLGEANLRLDIGPLPPPATGSAPERVVVLDGGRLVASGERLEPGLAAMLDGDGDGAGDGTRADATVPVAGATARVAPPPPRVPWAPRPGPITLRARGLAVGHGDRVLARELEIDLEPGQITLLAGPSGSGKSTLLATLAGLRQPHAGTLEAGDAPPPARVAWMPQFPEHAFWRRSVEDELRRAGECGPVETALDRVGLDPGVRTVSPFRLSGGERRRLAIACALGGRRPVLLLDEPGAGLDGPGMRLLERVVDGCAAAGAAILVVTPLRHWRGRADRVLELRGGRLQPHGKPHGAAAV